MDLLEVIVEALQLTFAFDLHFCDRPDPELSRMAEEIEEYVRPLHISWPASLTEDARRNPVVESYLRDLLGKLKELAHQAELIAERVEDRDPQDRTEDEACLGSRARRALVEFWRQLAAVSHARVEAENLDRAVSDQPLLDAIQAARGCRPAELVQGIGGTPFERELRQPGQTHLALPAYRRLCARIRRTWKLNVGQRAADGAVPQALARYARENGLEHAEAKQELIEMAFANALLALDRRTTVRVGQQWRKRNAVSIRIATDGSDDQKAATRWAETSAVTVARRRASLWLEDLPFYRAWKCIVNATIAGAEEQLLSSYSQVETNVQRKTHDSVSRGSPDANIISDALHLNGDAEVEARLTAIDTVRRVESAGMSRRQAELWLRTSDLPPGVRRELADRWDLEIPEFRQTRREAANNLGISPGTAGSHLNRARRKLRSIDPHD